MAIDIQQLLAERRAEFGDRIDEAVAKAARVFERFVARDPDGSLRLYVSNFVSTPDTREAGLTNSPEGFRTAISIELETLCLLYAQDILDAPEAQLTKAIIESDKEQEIGWGQVMGEFGDWLVEFDLHEIEGQNYPDIDWIWRVQEDNGD